MNVKLAPPLVDLNRPKGGLGVGGLVVAPPLKIELTPRTPRVDETYKTFEWFGSTTIELIDRPAKASPVYVPFAALDVVVFDMRCFQLFPPSVDM
jgi:hypothetical protein